VRRNPHHRKGYAIQAHGASQDRRITAKPLLPLEAFRLTGAFQLVKTHFINALPHNLIRQSNQPWGIFVITQ
jgi:hypothetical protein